jgi:hypothetical protein
LASSRSLTDAIFPLYIVHRTVIVVVGHNLARLRLPLGLEAALLLAATATSCALACEFVRGVRWLRPWFGLKRPTLVAALATVKPLEQPVPLQAGP